MSNYHVLEMDEMEYRPRIAFHIPVPDELNVSGKNLRVAVKEYLESNSPTGTITSIVPWISVGELTDLQNGVLYERVETFQFSNRWLTDLQKRNELDVRFNILNAVVPNEIRSRLKYWGMDRDVT